MGSVVCTHEMWFIYSVLLRFSDSNNMSPSSYILIQYYQVTHDCNVIVTNFIN